MVAFKTVPRASSRSSASRRKLVVRVQIPTYGDDGHCACIPTRRSITAVGESRFRSSSSWRASAARFSSRSVRTRSTTRLEVDAHHDAALGGLADLLEACCFEDAAGTDVQLAPDDVLPGLHEHRIALERTRAAFARVLHRC